MNERQRPDGEMVYDTETGRTEPQHIRCIEFPRDKITKDVRLPENPRCGRCKQQLEYVDD